ncbi:hypothetical protein MMC07_008295 [Pseudocyphellaria aurata]|nr:hypothetical protein [Pseudocyphellaria aurata]
MGKMNYTKRKIDGLKLGQVVAKDLLKRIPPNITSKAAIRDPIIDLDVSGRALTNEGVFEIAAALVKSIEYEDDNGRVARLEELCLRDSQIDTASLPHLARIISSSAHDLRDLDLSENSITITTDDDASAWEYFLKSFSNCCVLRRVDLSGNKLSSRAFDVLTRIYGKEDPIDLTLSPEKYACFEKHTMGFGGFNQAVTELGSLTRKSSIASSAEKDEDDAENMSLAGVDQKHGSRHVEPNTPERSGSVHHAEVLQTYATTRGLRSVPYLILSQTAMEETCALYLSYIVVCHNKPEQLLTRVPAAKAGPPAQHLLAYDNETRCRGIVYLPNSQLGTAAMKVLDLSEAVREGLFDDLDSEENSEEVSPVLKSANATRKALDTRGSPARSGRRQSTLSMGSTDHGRYRSKSGISIELDRARSRIQGHILEEFGPGSNHLWRVALKMLTLGRNIRPVIQKKQSAIGNGRVENLKLRNSPNITSRKPSSATPLANRSPNQPITTSFGQWRLDNSQLVPITTTQSSPIKLSPPSSPLISTALKVPYRTSLPCGFPEEVWRRIMAIAAGAENIMSEAQQRSVLRWAMDRDTLGKERESLGLKEGAQIWKVLEGMGCLAYEMKL